MINIDGSVSLKAMIKQCDVFSMKREFLINLAVNPLLLSIQGKKSG